MVEQYDLKKEWAKARKHLTIYGKEALKLAQKGEKEILRFSKEGKLRFDAAALGLKQEQLYYRIGKEYIKAKCPGRKNAKLKKLIEELRRAIKEQKTLNLKIKSSGKR